MDSTLYNPEKKMKKPVEVWQIVIAFAGLLLCVGTIVVNLATKVNTLETQNNYTGQYLREMSTNMKEMNGKMTDILITLQNKQDRPK